ncbi:MAG: GLUG motif-containing protein, partial [Acutalibacteraceae bacterium]|nr:GLUG motif-containing protein [Acutalibacteraceae bacterium]
MNSGNFETWTPIGNYDNRYIGTFDGAGHTLIGLYFNDSSEESGGLFDYVGENGVVTNVGVTDCYFNGRTGVGGLCGNNYGKITNCFARGTVFSRECVGGL